MKKPFSNEAKWIQVPQKLNLDAPYLKGIPLRPIGDNAIQYQIETSKGSIKMQINNDKTYMMSDGKLFDDMCDMDILNEPQVLNNLVQRYKNDKIFTFIGPTLVVVNPYRFINQYFSNQVMLAMRNKIIQGHTSKQKPHIYLIAGNAYTSMIGQNKKQAIVISGESGAGKTESTKYCMRLLTSLSHKQAHPIQAKILACNPILQAFGNSKTTRNDNSSRFGKYVQIFFAADNTIAGANIFSYLLQKSRVVAAAEKQRNFHIFYALVASKTIDLKSYQNYKYLERTKCYDAVGIDDKEYFNEIKQSMTNIGFSSKDQTKIWELMASILQLGNVQFDDQVHRQDPNKACKLTQASKQQMERISNFLNIKQADLQRILLYEKKIFLKQVNFSPYSKQKCIANANTLSKAIYNSTFEFILYKIQKSLRPEHYSTTNSKYLSINILDVFGFQNFEVNSFQQFCINFTNQKLLKLYNQYVFQRQMKILHQDGLQQHISSIKPPTNQAIIETMSGKISMFSIINDNTIPIQFKDSDIITGFQKIPKSGCLEFDKIKKNKFTILHSQCNVKYDIDGFKQKNQDKVLPEIADIVNKLFENQNKDQIGKTLLAKFSKQIDDLMSQLTSSNVHFIRCIKPNEKKIPKSPQDKYILTQVRYLGVFQTIQIRKKTFPSRWLYDQFIQRFQSLFPLTKGDNKFKTQKILQNLTKDTKEYLLGNQRIYMNAQIQAKLSRKLHEVMKKKIQSGKKIWKSYKKYKFKKQIKMKLKLLVHRIHCWKNIAMRLQIQIKKNKFQRIKQFVNNKKQQERKKKIQQQQRKENQNKITKQMKQAKQIKSSKQIKQVKQTKQIKANDQVQNKIPIVIKEQNKLTEQQLNQTVIDYSSVSDQKKYERNVQESVDQQRQFDIHQSFVNDKTILAGNNEEIAFQGTLTVPFFNPKQVTEQFKRLKSILADKFKPQYEEVPGQDFLSPLSMDSKFNLEDTPQQLMLKIIQFDNKSFFKRVLRKRTNAFGMSKNQDDILVAKSSRLNKSLTLIDPEDQKDAFRIFSQILIAGKQAKLESVFGQVQKIMFLCKAASPELVNEILLQLIKQSNTSNQLCSIRIIQALVVFLHIFQPDKDFLLASLNFLFKKLSQGSFSQRQGDYFKYAFKKMIRKYQHKTQVGFMPIKYQIMALMCKRVISVPIYLTVGSSYHVKVESYETLSDIKIRVMEELGIDYHRLNPDYFGFFELTNFIAGISEQKPLNQRINVWDLVSYWQRSTEKYSNHSQNAPTFYLVLKIKFLFECHIQDEEAIELTFGQIFFDYFMGRIVLPLKQLGMLAACIKKLKFPNTEAEDYTGCYPEWALNKFTEKQLSKQMSDYHLTLSKQALQYKSISEQQFVKFRFVKVGEMAPLCMSFSIPSDQPVKMNFRFKMIYLTKDNHVLQEIPIKSITKYAEQGQYFVYNVRGSSQSKMIHTQHASICLKYMAMLQELVTKKATTANKGNNSILKGLQNS